MGSSRVPPARGTACSLHQDFSSPHLHLGKSFGASSPGSPPGLVHPSSLGGACDSSLPQNSSSSLETDHTLLAYKNSPHPPSAKPSCGPTLSSNSPLWGDATSPSTDEGADSSKTSSNPGRRTQAPGHCDGSCEHPHFPAGGIFRTNGSSQQPFPVGLGSLLPDLEPSQAHLSDL